MPGSIERSISRVPRAGLTVGWIKIADRACFKPRVDSMLDLQHLREGSYLSMESSQLLAQGAAEIALVPHFAFIALRALETIKL